MNVTSHVVLLVAFVAALAADVALAITVGADSASTLGIGGIAVGLAGALAGVAPPGSQVAQLIARATPTAAPAPPQHVAPPAPPPPSGP